MKRSELFTRLLIGFFLLSIFLIVLTERNRTTLIHARMAESGGWDPDVIHAVAGEPLHLRFTSDEVMHGFSIGQIDMQPVDIEPGKVSEVFLNFDKPGTYTFFCTRWCGLNHWRMRGTIMVTGETNASRSDKQAENSDESIPLYVKLGLDLDAPHPAQDWPSNEPSAERGLRLFSKLPFDPSKEFYITHSPVQVFQELGSSGLNPDHRWDLVSAIWQVNTTLDGLLEGQNLYAQNCSACHGESGAGDGVFSDQLADEGILSSNGMSSTMDMGIKKPVAFSEVDLLGASPVLLYGKILRGGMGTGMPMWGSIFTDDQIWNLVAYLYTFHLK